MYGCRVTTYAGWMSYGDFAFDMAVFHLNEPISTIGTFSLIASDSYANRQLITAGYPGDKPSGTQWNATCLVSESNPADGVSEAVRL
jgi:V8-like Glu-specific endopeptidase